MPGSEKPVPRRQGQAPQRIEAVALKSEMIGNASYHPVEINGALTLLIEPFLQDLRFAESPASPFCLVPNVDWDRGDRYSHFPAHTVDFAVNKQGVEAFAGKTGSIPKSGFPKKRPSAVIQLVRRKKGVEAYRLVE